MKLLASLLGCAVADYACCPYDEFGVVNPGCPLTEKTPWAMTNSNADADPAGVEVHLCKAWEANIDGTMEGNEDKDNWGGCGFQRHFSWAVDNLVHGGATSGQEQHCKYGMADCSNLASADVKYKEFQAGTTNFKISGGSASPFTAQNTNDVFGQITLGGICKLFVPVRKESIDSVSIAGVHLNGPASYVSATASVFDAKICDTANCATGGNEAIGTAYCFSVVNIGEFMENTNNIMNANVAGTDAGGHDAITEPGENGQAFSVNFGQSIEPTNEGGGAGTLVEAGANFDVVVHFKSDYCIRHWSITDMQTDPDWNSGGTDDYPLNSVSGVPQHAHTDVADKRIPGQVGICGCCSGTKRHDDTSYTTNAPVVCGDCTLTDNTCADFDTYSPMVPSGMKWPNVGAWAAYYSFITCADGNFMVYDRMGGAPDTTTGAFTVTPFKRDVVHSMFYNDVRHDWSNANGGTGDLVVRGNFRQVGSEVKYCGPGTLPTDINTERCTWNWNFVKNTDAESWFERTAPQSHSVWKNGAAVDRNVENDAFTANTHVAGVVETHTYTLNLRAAASGNDVSQTPALTVDASKYFTVTAGTHAAADGFVFTIKQECLRSDNAAKITTSPALYADLGDTTSTNVRDLFPDCYMGDEIHFSLTVSASAPSAESTGAGQYINAWYSTVQSTFSAQ